MLTDNQRYKHDTVTGAFEASGITPTNTQSRLYKHYLRLTDSLSKKLTWKELESLEFVLINSSLRVNHLELKKQNKLKDALDILSGMDVGDDDERKDDQMTATEWYLNGEDK